MECKDNQKGVLHAWKITYNDNTIESVHLRNIHPKIIYERPLLLTLKRAATLNRVCCHRDRYLVYWENAGADPGGGAAGAGSPSPMETGVAAQKAQGHLRRRGMTITVGKENSRH